MLNPSSCRKHCAVTGHIPFHVGVVHKDCKNPISSDPTQRIFGSLTRKEEAEFYRQKVAIERRDSRYRHDWSRNLQKKILDGNARREVETVLRTYEESVEERRTKLHNLLEEEEKVYICELESYSKKPDDHLQEILRKLNSYRQQREETRLKTVKEKMDQRFVENCEELRTKLKSQLKDAVLSDRREQVREREALRKMQQLEQQYYDCLWHTDYLNKLHRDEQDALARHAGNMDMLATLDQQVATKKAYKNRLQELLKEEAETLAEQQRQFELEEKQKREEQQKKKLELKESVEQNLEVVQARKAREDQEESEFDFLYSRMVNEANQKSEETARSKQQRFNEAKQYLQHVATEKQERAAMERENNRLIEEENERMWEKYTAQKEFEKASRKKLFDGVIATRRRQIEEKIFENTRQKQELLKEVEGIRKMIEFNKDMAKDEAENHRKTIEKYRIDILNQIDYQKEQQKLREEEMKREYETYIQQEDHYQQKLRETLHDPKTGSLHPMRSAALWHRNPFPADDLPLSCRGEDSDTMAHMQMRIRALSQLVEEKQRELCNASANLTINTKSSHFSSRRHEPFNNILSYYTED